MIQIISNYNKCVIQLDKYNYLNLIIKTTLSICTCLSSIIKMNIEKDTQKKKKNSNKFFFDHKNSNNLINLFIDNSTIILDNYKHARMVRLWINQLYMSINK